GAGPARCCGGHDPDVTCLRLHWSGQRQTRAAAVRPHAGEGGANVWDVGSVETLIAAAVATRHSRVGAGALGDLHPDWASDVDRKRYVIGAPSRVLVIGGPEVHGCEHVVAVALIDQVSGK